MLCVESFVRSRGVDLYTHLGLSRSRFMSKNLVIALVAA